LGADLERDRLEHRIRRVTVAITALHQRASEHRAELGTIPRQLGQAIADFEAQIAAINARLRDLTPSSVHPAIEGSGPPRPSSRSRAGARSHEIAQRASAGSGSTEPCQLAAIGEADGPAARDRLHDDREGFHRGPHDRAAPEANLHAWRRNR